jgi:acetyl esterase/lipase
MTHEVAAAIGWTLENIGRYGGDPRHVVVCGHSSGGHLVGLAMMDPRLLRVYGHAADGGVANFDTASPIHYVRADLPPVLILHGDADQTISVDQATEFHAALQAAGALSELIICPGRGHSEVLFAALAERRAQIVADIATFVHNANMVRPNTTG